MPNISHWKQANSDYALVQAGSQGADQTGVVFGAKTGQAVLVDWEDLRWSALTGSPSYVGFFDHFVGDAIDARWDEDISLGATVAINAQQNGVVRLATDTDDDDHATLALGLHWLVSKGWTYFTAGVKSVSAITLRAIEAGVSDAVSETAGLAFSDHSASGVTAVATNAAVFGYDTDASMTTWATNSVNGGGTPVANEITQAPSTTAFQQLSIAINAAGDAFFYVNGTLVATHLLAVATTSVFTPWISLKSLSGAIKTIDVDYVGIAGAR